MSRKAQKSKASPFWSSNPKLPVAQHLSAPNAVGQCDEDGAEHLNGLRAQLSLDPATAGEEHAPDTGI